MSGRYRQGGPTISGFNDPLLPAGDGTEWDENVAARLLYKLIGWTLRSEQKS